MIHVAEFNGGQIRLEISNQDEFIRRVKAEARAVKRKKMSGDWKIRLIGGDRITAPVQKLIDELAGQKSDLVVELGKTAERTGETPAEILEAAKAELSPANGKPTRPVRPRPGGPLTNN